MWGKNSKSVAGKLFCSESDCLPHKIQTSTRSVAEEEVPKHSTATSDICVEDGKLCKCDKNDWGVTVANDTPGAGAGAGAGAGHALKANSSFTHTVINMMAMLFGLGQLSTPYALENGGWASAFLFVGLGMICAYTAHLLGRCLNKNPKLGSYTDIGQQAFGTTGRVLAAAFIYMEIFMDLLSYTISLHDNLNTVLAGIPIKVPPILHLSKSQLLTVLAILVAIPSLWLRNLSSLSFLSTAGIFTSLLIVVTVTSTALIGGVSANHYIPVLHIQNIPHISGIYMFCYAGHMIFPNVYKAMKDPSKFTKAAIMSFTMVTFLYTSLAFMGAKLFGPGVKSQITLSMPPGLIITKIALWATVLSPMTKYALEFTPLATQLEHNLPNSMNSRTRMIVRGSLGSILLLVILTLALCVPYFQYVLNLTGSFVSITICIILPCTFYTKIFQDRITKPHMILNMTIIILGSLLCIFGTVSSARSLIQTLKSRSS